MDTKTNDYYYLKLAISNILDHPAILLIFFILEYLSIFSNFLLSTYQIINNEYSYNNDPIKYLSPYNIMKEKIKGNRIIPFAIVILTILLLCIYKLFVKYANKYLVSNNNK